jgi:hypothetical protein
MVPRFRVRTAIAAGGGSTPRGDATPRRRNIRVDSRVRRSPSFGALLISRTGSERASCRWVNGRTLGCARLRLSKPENENWQAGPDRRRRRRVDLHWTVYLWPDETAQPIRSETRNICSGGFYCIVEQPLMPGEWIECDIFVPSTDNPHEDLLVLRSCVQVLRVEVNGTGSRYGLACRIEDYSVGIVQRQGKVA